MIVLGLTGSIGMGKSTVLEMSRSLKIPTFDSDDAVSVLLAEDHKVIDTVSKLFPEVMAGKTINKFLLGNLVFKNKEALQFLEDLLHPKIYEEIQQFLKRHRRQRCKRVMLDIPLLFEKNRQEIVDRIICVTAPFFVQKTRVLKRSGMTEEKFQAILDRQWPTAQKCRESDFILPTGCAKAETFRCLKKILKECTNA